MKTRTAILLKQARMVSARLGALPPDSKWARRASGSRRALLRFSQPDGQPVNDTQLQQLEEALAYAYYVLEKVASEIPETEGK